MTDLNARIREIHVLFYEMAQNCDRLIPLPMRPHQEDYAKCRRYLAPGDSGACEIQKCPLLEE